MEKNASSVRPNVGRCVFRRVARASVALAASLAMAASMVPAVPAAFAAGAESADGLSSSAQSVSVSPYGGSRITSSTHEINKSGAYYVAEDTTVMPGTVDYTLQGNGIKIAENIDVLIYIPADVTLTVYGGDGTSSPQSRPGRAAIYLPKSSTLTITGSGTLNATGGKATNGASGWNGNGASYDTSGTDVWKGGKGGDGGEGGNGAGAGIGTDGGAGGAGGAGGSGHEDEGTYTIDAKGDNGASGAAGEQAKEPGQVYLAGNVTVNARGGAAATQQASGGTGGDCKFYNSVYGVYSVGGGSGGGGGAGGEGAVGIGRGGAGGSGGGGGGGGGLYRTTTIFGCKRWCGAEGGAGGNAVKSALNGLQGAQSGSIDEVYTAYRTDWASTPGGSAAAVSSTKQESLVMYRSSSAAASFLPSVAPDTYTGKTYSSKVLAKASEFKGLKGYTTNIVIYKNDGTDDVLKTLTVVPGAEPVNTLYSAMASRSGDPTRSNCAFAGYSTNASDESGIFFTPNAGKDGGAWKNEGTDNPLYASGYVNGSLGTSSSTLAQTMWMGLSEVSLYAAWSGNDYDVTYDINTARLNALGVEQNPTWVSTSSTVVTKAGTTSTDAGFVYGTPTSLAISSSMHSQDGTAFPSNQGYYLQTDGTYRLVAWTDSIGAEGNATGVVYKLGQEVSDLASGKGQATLYAVWALTDTEDIYEPSTSAGPDVAAGYGYTADEGTVTAYVEPLWGKSTSGDYGSYYLASLLSASPTHKLTAKWQVLNAATGEWEDVKEFDGYQSSIDWSAFQKNGKTITPADSDYKAGKYVGSKIAAKLAIPQGWDVAKTASGAIQYRCTFSLAALDGSGKALESMTPAVSVKVVAGDYDTSSWKYCATTGDNTGDVISTSGYSVEYDGMSHGYSVDMGEAGKNVSCSIAYYDYETGQKLDAAPVEPGKYLASFVYSVAEADPNHNVPAAETKGIVIEKQTLETPVAKSLTYKLKDLQSGEGSEQCAFDEEYTANPLYSAENCSQTEAGSYSATFTIEDTSHYTWKNTDSASIEVPYTIEKLNAQSDGKSIAIAGSTGALAWNGVNNVYSADVNRVYASSVSCNLFEGNELPTWITHWVNGKPSGRDSAYYSYWVANESGGYTQVVGYDADGVLITAEQIELWMNGAESGQTIDDVTAKSFADVATFGLKLADAQKCLQVSINLMRSSNCTVSGDMYAAFAVSKAGTPAIKLDELEYADGTAKVPSVSYRYSDSDEWASGLPSSVSKVSFYEYDVQVGGWSTTEWGSIASDGTVTGGITEPVTGGVLLKAVFTPSESGVTVPADQYVNFNVRQSVVVVDLPVGGSFTYDATEKTGVAAGEGYTLEGTLSATDAGEYEVTATLASADARWSDGTNGVKAIKWSIAKKSVAKPAAVQGLTYTGKAQVGVMAGEGYALEGADQATAAGSYAVTAKLVSANYIWADATDAAVTVNWSIAKAQRSVKASVKIVKAKKLKKSKAKVKPLSVTGLEGAKASFAKVKKGSQKKALKALKVAKGNGAVTIKKGTKKGVYKLKVKVCVPATVNYEAFSKVITVKVKVK